MWQMIFVQNSPTHEAYPDVLDQSTWLRIPLFPTEEEEWKEGDWEWSNYRASLEFILPKKCKPFLSFISFIVRCSL